MSAEMTLREAVEVLTKATYALENIECGCGSSAASACEISDNIDAALPALRSAVAREEADLVAKELRDEELRSQHLQTQVMALRSELERVRGERDAMEKAVERAANTAHMEGRIYNSLGEKETPGQVCEYMGRIADIEIRQVLRPAPGPQAGETGSEDADDE